MNRYIGTEMIQAKEVTLGKYNEYRGWDTPEDEDESTCGYMVEYADGYESWSPKTVFEQAYLPCDEGLPFSVALEAVKRGERLFRVGWNGGGMFIFLVPGSTFQVNRPPLLGIYDEGTEITYHAHIDMRTADGQIVPWLASQTDILASDWVII